MTERDRKLAGVASLLVTISVAANMIAFQDKGQGSIIETGGLGARTAWVDGPGLNLGSTVTVPVAAPPPAPVAPARRTTQEILARPKSRAVSSASSIRAATKPASPTASPGL